MKQLVAGALIVACVALVANVATAQSSVPAAKKELQTAMYHAGELAQRGKDAPTSLLHLQHVMNCLEGPNGKNFKASAGNPCQGQGAGILNDLQAAQAAHAKGADRAAHYARAAHDMAANVLGYTKGSKAYTDLNAIQPWAKQIAAQLKLALSALQ